MSLRRSFSHGHALLRALIARRPVLVPLGLLTALLIGAATMFSMSGSPVPADKSALFAEVAAARTNHDAVLAQLSNAREAAAVARSHHDSLLSRSIHETHVEKPAITQNLIENPNFLKLDADLGTLQDKRQRMADRLTDAHPEMQALDREIRDLQSRLHAVPQLMIHQNDAAATTSANETHATVNADLLDEIELARREIDAADERVANAEAAERVAIDRRLTAERKLARASVASTAPTRTGPSVASVMFVGLAFAAAVYFRQDLLRRVRVSLNTLRTMIAARKARRAAAQSVVPRRRAA